MSQRLQDKVAVITGGSTGIGRASAELFVAEGARLVVGDINDEAGKELEDQFPGVVIYQHADVSSEAQIESLVSTAVDRFGKLDIMFNNAGGGGFPGGILEITEEGYEQTQRVYQSSVVFGHKHAALAFKRQGSGGSIISTASIASLQGGHSILGYTVAKHAVIGIVRQAAAELGPLGIRSNAICPGITMTDIMVHAFGVPIEEKAEFLALLGERLASHQPMGRVGQPRDIANAALFLASDEAEWITGAVLPVDGGHTAVTLGGWPAAAAAAAQEFLASR